jgi:hypothetical protein
MCAKSDDHGWGLTMAVVEIFYELGKYRLSPL